MSVRHNRAKTKLIFFRNREPVVRRFMAYSTLDEKGYPKGDGRRVRNRVMPRRAGEAVTSWKVVFRADAERRPFMDVHVVFPTREIGGCEEGGSASYSFGLERRGGS